MRLDAVASVSAQSLAAMFEEDFDALVTAAIADATRRLPRASQRLLRSKEWHQDWLDALTWAEGELQVSAERMAFSGDRRHERVEDELRRVRNRLSEARTLVKKHRRREHQEVLFRESAEMRTTALTWLTKAYPEEHQALREAALHTRGLGPIEHPAAAKDVFDSLDAAAEHDWITAVMTPQVAALLRMNHTAFRNTVADDARDQNERNIPLRHPALLRRWHQTLDELLEKTAELAQASSVHSLGTLTADLRNLPQEDAYKILNARRFFCAMQQRKTECARTIRQLMLAAETRKNQDPELVARHQADAEAREQLAAAHPDELEHILASLRPYQTAPGVLDTVGFTTNMRGELKALIVGEIRAVTALGLP